MINQKTIDRIECECGRCGVFITSYGGYSVNKLKDLCKKCWDEYIKMRNRHCIEENKWWRNGKDTRGNLPKV